MFAWYDRRDLPYDVPGLMGVLEVPEREGVLSVELHLFLVMGGTVGFWLDDSGEVLAKVVAGDA